MKEGGAAAAPAALRLAFEPTRGTSAAPARPFLLSFVLVVMVVLLAAAAALAWSIQQRAQQLERQALERLVDLADGHAAMLETWLEGVARLGLRLTRSDLVQLFASEMAAHPAGQSLPPWLADQIPYMSQIFAEFVARQQLHGASLIGLDGRTFLVSQEAPLRGFSADFPIDRLNAGQRIVRPVRALDEAAGRSGKLALDVVLPVMTPQAPRHLSPRPIAALVMTVPAGALLETLAAWPGASAGRRVQLLQQNAEGREEVVREDAAGRPPADHAGAEGQHVPWLPGLSRWAPEPSSLQAEAAIAGSPWLVRAERSAEDLVRPLRAYASGALVPAAGAGVALVLVIGAILKLLYRSQCRWADRQAPLADALVLLRQLLFRMMGGWGASLQVIDRQGFVIGREPALNGGHDHPVLEPEAEAKLAGREREVVTGDAVPDHPIEVELGAARRATTITLLPLQDGAGEVAGVARLFGAVRRDDGDQRREQLGALAQALVNVASRTDASLPGRVHRNSAYACAVGERLGLDHDHLETLTAAATLLEVTAIRQPARAGRAQARASSGTGSARPDVFGDIGAIEEILSLLESKPPGEPPPTSAGPASGEPGQEATGLPAHKPLGGSPAAGPVSASGREQHLPSRILRVVGTFCAILDGATGCRLSPGQALYALVRQQGSSDAQVLSALAAVAGSRGRPGAEAGTEGADPDPGARAKTPSSGRVAA